MLLVGAFGPSLVAVVLTAQGSGRTGVKALLGRLLIWRVNLRWYAFALGYMATVKLTVAIVCRVSRGHWPHFGEHSVGTIVVLIVVVGVMGGPLGEEIGWRGYALPRLTRRLGLAPASLLLGLVWSLWHLPLFVLSVGGDQFGQSFPTYLLQVTALSVAMAWLMGNTGGQPAARRPVPLGDQPDQGHRAGHGHRRPPRLGAEHLLVCLANGRRAVGGRGLLPEPHAVARHARPGTSGATEHHAQHRPRVDPAL